jgi:dTDP-4-amino-4,6-dideoxygalactose transaminase
VSLKRATGSAAIELEAEFEPWPQYEADEVQAASRVLESGKVNYWTGSEGTSFEAEFADYIGVSHAVACANGTVAIDLALHALGIGEGDEVVVTPRSFIASVSPVILCGARPVFADVDRDSGNLTAETVEAALSERTKAILLVHLAGWPCEMNAIMELARTRGIAIIEDCAQAHGATYYGAPVGSLGEVNAWSFCQDKIMTTGGEGGMVTTNDPELWRRMWSFKDHGKDYDAVFYREHPPGFRWVHESFGTNWRLTEMQAAIGRRQLRKLDEWVQVRRAHAQLLTEGLADFEPLRLATPPDHVTHAYYKYYLYVRPEMLKAEWSRDRILEEIEAQGVPCFSGSCSEIYLETAFDGTDCRPAERLPVARELGETSLMFLVHPTLSKAAICRTAEVVRDVVGLALR